MMVRVDQAGQKNVTFEIEHFIGGVWQTGSLPHGFNETVTNKKATVGNFPLVVVHGDDVGVFDEKGWHWSVRWMD